MPNFTLASILMILVVFIILLGVLFLSFYIFNQIMNKKKIERNNKFACKAVINAHKKQLLTDYFWSDYMRFAWITFFLFFFIALGLALEDIIATTISIGLMVLTYFFMRFAKKSYQAFPEKAATRLKKFEDEVKAGLKNEISFKGDNIQVFSKKDESFDTNPQLFSFPTGISKIAFPPFQKNARKQPIIHTRKLEFLILSREYFSICQGAATFNLLNPDRAGPPKQCVELPGRAGECHEHYYSQMRNVEYDTANECIRIIYYDERDDVEFPCKKMNPDRKSAIKALQEKLRLTERQRLHKINEHEKYEELLERRKNDIHTNETEQDPKEDE